MISYEEARRLVERVCEIVPAPPRYDDEDLRLGWERLVLDAARKLAAVVPDAEVVTLLLDDEYGVPEHVRPLRRVLLRAARQAIRRGRCAPVIAAGKPRTVCSIASGVTSAPSYALLMVPSRESPGAR